MILRNIIAAAMAAGALSAFAWGQKGHDVTAAIAERHLTPRARAAVDSLLDGKSLVYWANWLDNASHTPQYAYSKTWHYKNIDAGQAYEQAPRNEKGDVETAIRGESQILKSTASSREQKALALKMITHLVGDAHQPMHVGHLSDLGGNKWEVMWFNTPVNLHGTWDSNVVEAAHKWSYTEWVDQIDRLTPEEAVSISAGAPTDWVKETWAICTDVYNTTPQGSTLSYDYTAKWAPIVEQQLLRGGHRLAALLNSIFE